MPNYQNLSPHPEALGVIPLSDGESTRTMRVRALSKVIIWAAALSAAERGNILAAAYSARDADQPKASHAEISAGRVLIGSTFPRQAGAAVLINEIRQGGALTEEGGVWTMTLPDGAARTVGPHVMRNALREGVLVLSSD